MENCSLLLVGWSSFAAFCNVFAMIVLFFTIPVVASLNEKAVKLPVVHILLMLAA